MVRSSAILNTVQHDGITASRPWHAPRLLELLAPPMPDANCRGEWLTYDAAAAGDPAAIEAAQACCGSCVALDDCRAHRSSLPERQRRAHGVLAGILTRPQPRSANHAQTTVVAVQPPRRRPPRPAEGLSARTAQRRALRAARREVQQRAARRAAAS